MKSILEFVSMPKYLYHGSSTQNLKTLGTDTAITSHDYQKTKILTKRLYAMDSKQMAAAFTFQWNDGIGVKYGTWDDGPYSLEVPKKYLYLLEKPCSIYTISSKGFTKSPGKFIEYFTSESVDVISEEKFDTCYDAMKKYKCELKEI